mgnify:CR=1 FL=1
MLTFSSEQQQFRDSLRRMLAADYSFERRREIAASARGWSAATWRQLAELGVLALTLPEAHGGLGGGAMDAYVVMEEAGRALLLEPWLSPAQVTDGHVKADRANRPGLFVQRMNYTRIVGNRSLLDIHYLIGTDSGVRHVQELRTLTLFTDAEYRIALKAAGFGDVVLEAYGPQGRGLYIAQV